MYMPSFNFTVDGEPLSTAEHELSPRQILQEAELDPSSYYLIELRGPEQISFQSSPDSPIHMHDNLRFIAVFTGPVPVSR